MNKKILDKAKKIKVLAMDVDGVLTRGEMIVLDSGEEIKIWNVKDRFAFSFPPKLNLELKFVWITGRGSSHVSDTAEQLGIDALYQNCEEKLPYWKEMLEEFSVSPDAVAYIGDDLMDLPLIKRAGLSVCPKNAPKEMKNMVDYVSLYDGGDGVVRETIEMILKARGVWKQLVSLYTR